jgi:thiol-disulfide isomerase/thioredoxin
MKKIVTLILALAIGFGLKAQCPLTTAVDFTATDVHGTEVHLFDILDGGQYVLIDFFFTTCVPCQQATPKIVESYYAMGCNQHDVFYMEIATGDTEAACLNWVNTYGVEYPTISGVAGGTSICNQYQVGAYPTVILIAPNRQIVIQDLWPINNAQAVISALEAQGLQQHDCNGTTYDPQVTITIDQVLETEVTATFTPNEDCASYAYTMATEAEIQEWMAIAGLDLPNYLWNYGIPSSGTISNTFNDLTPNTEYMIYAVPADIDGNLGDVVQEPVTTTPGGSTEIMPDFTATDINGNTIHLYEILDAGQAVLINFFLSGDEFSEAAMPDMLEAYRLYGCNMHDVFFMEICPNAYDEACQAWVDRFGVQYPTISRTGGGNDIAQAIPVGYYPTIMLIRPDHTFANRDIYPPTLEYIINAMNTEGYEQYECPFEETLTFSTNTVNLNWGELTWITIYNNTAEDATITSICDERYELGFTLDGQEMFSCYFPMEFTIPQGGAVELGILCEVVGKRAVVPDLVTITSNLPDAHFTVMVDDTWSVDENETSATLFPNPANDFVTLKGEDLGTVRVYNTLGQKVGEFVANGSELRINTAGYGNGVYVVKAGEKTLRFVVRH